jgi:hypothetical protein
MKTKNQKNQKKNRLPLIIAAALIVTAAALRIVIPAINNRADPVWLVEPEFEAVWNRTLTEAGKNVDYTATAVYDPQETLSGKQYGFIITTKGPQPENMETTIGEGKKLFVYRRFSSNGEYGNTVALALDPWMIFRKFTENGLDRERVNSENGGDGTLILPGKQREARTAWLAQLLQEKPGSFPGDPLVWQDAEENLFNGKRFRQGARTYNWNDAFDLFFDTPDSWIYAPVSKIRALPNYLTGNLEATRFPEPDDWNNFGIEARILWAIPFGSAKNLEKIPHTLEWLKNGETQTSVANALKWIPASSSGKPYNPVSRAAWITWLNSSFVWTEQE